METTSERAADESGSAIAGRGARGQRLVQEGQKRLSPVIVVFGKYFGYAVGGAERSMVEVLRRKEREGYRICAVVCDGVTSLGAQRARMTLPQSWEVKRFRFGVDLLRFRHLGYWLNRAKVRAFFAQLPQDSLLYAYGSYAPAAVLGFRGRAIYFVRDEYGLGWDVNYDVGLRRIARYCYQWIEWPLRRLWLADLRRCVAKADLVANSAFIARELGRLAQNKPVEVQIPTVDCAALRAEYSASVAACEIRRGILMIGNDLLKGTDILLRIAARMPDQLFYVFDRHTCEPKTEANVCFMPWQSSQGALYAHARLVLVPSRWAEAFGRTVVEAQCLGIPVVASARGGIPETVADQNCLVDDIDDIDAWIAKIRQRL